MRKMLAGFNGNTLIIMLVSGVLCWMQTRVLNAVYLLPGIEQQLITFKENLNQMRMDLERERRDREEADREKDARIRQMENKVGKMP